MKKEKEKRRENITQYPASRDFFLAQRLAFTKSFARLVSRVVSLQKKPSPKETSARRARSYWFLRVRHERER